MATTFRDGAGREWSVKVTIGSLRRCLDLSGIDILNLFGQRQSAQDGEEPSPPPVLELFLDLDVLGRTLYAVCKPDADKRGVEIDEFLDALSGDVIEEARRALLESCVTFYPSPAMRRAFRTVVTELLSQFARAEEEASAGVTQESLRALMQAAPESEALGEASTS